MSGEERTCRGCGQSFVRQIKPGRPPEYCSACGGGPAANKRSYREANKAKIAAKQRSASFATILAEARALKVPVSRSNGHLVVAGERVDTLEDWQFLRVDLERRAHA